MILTFSNGSFVPQILAGIQENPSAETIKQALCGASLHGGNYSFPIASETNKVLNGQLPIKRHTLRKGSHWKAGDTIHFWKGNPRNKKNNPFHFATGTCTGTQEVEMALGFRSGTPPSAPSMPMAFTIAVDGRLLNAGGMGRFAANDGFDSVAGLLGWFLPSLRIGEPLKLQLVHWTDKRY